MPLLVGMGDTGDAVAQNQAWMGCPGRWEAGFCHTSSRTSASSGTIIPSH